jgi:hypothetical protein
LIIKALPIKVRGPKSAVLNKRESSEIILSWGFLAYSSISFQNQSKIHIPNNCLKKWVDCATLKIRKKYKIYEKNVFMRFNEGKKNEGKGGYGYYE